MLARTHLAIGLFSVLLLLPHIAYKFIFVPVVLIATLLPDIDSGYSTFGRRLLFKPVQMFTRHRGFLHSFTFCIIVSVIFSLYLPILAFPFFLGYSLHLIADSFTVEGVRPFWPAKEELKGKIGVGGVIEHSVFVVFLLVDVVLLFSLFI